MKYDDYVVIVPYFGGEVLLQEQFKLGVKKLCIGFPAGFKKANESPLKAAQRELLEETGWTAKKWQELGTFYDNVSITDAKFTIFLATDMRLEGDEVNPDTAESPIKNFWVDLAELTRPKMAGACMELARALFIQTTI